MFFALNIFISFQAIENLYLTESLLESRFVSFFFSFNFPRQTPFFYPISVLLSGRECKQNKLVVFPMSFSLSGNKRSDEKMYFAAVIQVRKKKKKKKESSQW